MKTYSEIYESYTIYAYLNIITTIHTYIMCLIFF